MKERLLKFDENHNPTINYYNKLGKTGRVIVDKFEKYCLISASPPRAKKLKSNAIRFLVMAEKKIDDLDLNDLRDFLRILKESDFSSLYKNDVKGFVQRFLKWYFKDWSERFNDFEDIKYNSDAQRKKPITEKEIPSKEEVEKLVKAEYSIYWKTFLVVQYEGALRTGEARKLKWSMVEFDGEYTFLDITSIKNKNASPKKRIVPLKISTYYLRELEKDQEAKGRKSVFIFPSFQSVNNYVSSATANKRFSRLTKRVLGKKMNNYLLRHARGTELKKMVKENNLSKENAINIMGHSEKVFDKVYSHMNKKDQKEILKKQVFDVDYIAPEKKHKLEIEIDDLKKNNQKIAESMAEFINIFKSDPKTSKLFAKRNLAKMKELFPG